MVQLTSRLFQYCEQQMSVQEGGWEALHLFPDPYGGASDRGANAENKSGNAWPCKPASFLQMQIFLQMRSRNGRGSLKLLEADKLLSAHQMLQSLLSTILTAEV